METDTPDEQQEDQQDREAESQAPQADEENADGGRKPPPDDLTKDPAYEPPEPLKEIKGG